MQGLPDVDALLLNAGLVSMLSDVHIYSSLYRKLVEPDLLNVQKTLVVALAKLANSPAPGVPPSGLKTPDRRCVTRRESVETILSSDTAPSGVDAWSAAAKSQAGHAVASNAPVMGAVQAPYPGETQKLDSTTPSHAFQYDEQRSVCNSNSSETALSNQHVGLHPQTSYSSPQPSRRDSHRARYPMPNY